MSIKTRRVLITLAVILLVPVLLLVGAILLLQSERTERWVEARTGDAIDREVEIDGRVMRPKQLPIDALATHLVLKDGLLRLEPLTFGVADGHVKASIELDAREDTVRGNMDVDVQGLALSRVFPPTKDVQPSLGTLFGRAKLSGRGASVGDLLGSSNGQLSLAVNGGQVSLLLVELLGLDVAEAAQLLGAGKRRKEVELRCAVADFAVKGASHTPKRSSSIPSTRW